MEILNLWSSMIQKQIIDLFIPFAINVCRKIFYFLVELVCVAGTISPLACRGVIVFYLLLQIAC